MEPSIDKDAPAFCGEDCEGLLRLASRTLFLGPSDCEDALPSILPFLQHTWVSTWLAPSD